MAVNRRRWLAVLLVVAAMLGACGGDDDDDGASFDGVAEEPVTTTTAPADPCAPAGHGAEPTPEPSPGGLDIPEVPGACPVPLPSLGFGIAVPRGWEASVLTDEALDQLGDARLVRPAFLASARAWAADGAVFYTAGVADSGSVSDLKIYMTEGADTSPDALAARAQDLVDSGDVTDPTIAGDPADGRIRVDFTLPMPAADDSTATIEGVGSELLVADGDRLWRLIITSESRQAQDAVLLVFDSSLTFD